MNATQPTDAAPHPAARRRGARRSRQWAAVAGFFAGAAYSNFLIEFAVGIRLTAWRSLVSELSATSAPYNWLFRSLDVTAGLLIVALAVGLRRALPTGRALGFGAAALGAFGLACAAGALVPLDCEPSTNATCAAKLRATAEAQVSSIGTTWHDAAHTVVSGLEVAAAFAAMALLAWGLRRQAGWRRISAASFSLMIVAAGSSLAAFLREEHVGSSGGGLAQRAQILLFSGWLVSLSSALLHSTAGSRDER